MEREIISTADGSSTIFLPEWNEHYHSIHGAIQEAEHVFIEMGLSFWLEKNKKKEFSILEIGFGTGLNALVTWKAIKNQRKVNYTGIEAYPVSSEEIDKINYPELIDKEGTAHFFAKMHSSEWEKKVAISSHFRLIKHKLFFQDINFTKEFDLIYFDAFGAQVQPELWTEGIFTIMYSSLKKGGVLVTYSAKGSVRRALQKIGFIVERIPGPPGKREMLRASKI